MRLTDTHCHLASTKFHGETDHIIARAIESGVGRMVSLATGFHDIPANLALATAHPNVVFAALGIHPCDVHNETRTDWQDQLATIAQTPGVVAIGESGLDYYHPAPEGWEEDAYRARQRMFLRQHFEVAAALGLPIVLHSRDRDGQQSIHDALVIAREFAGKVRPMFHCFLGPWEWAAPILELDGILSFGGIATFSSARNTMEAARQAPAGCFTLETDSPYLAPVPHRGKRNEPAYVRHTAEFLAKIRGESIEELAKHTELSADGFFRFPKFADEVRSTDVL